MFLDSCPLCQLIKDNKCDHFGKFCVSTMFDGNKTIALINHSSNPSSEEIDEVFSLMGNVTSLVTDAGVPGHWAISAKISNWVTEGKSLGHETARP